MRNKEYIMQHGKLVLSEQALEKIKSLSTEWVEKTEITIMLTTGDNNTLPVDVIVDRIVVFLKNDEDQCLDVDDIFLQHLLSEYGGISFEGHVYDSEGAKWLVEIMYLLWGDFGVYKIHLESDNVNFIPSLN